MIRVILADDHAVVRAGVRALVASDPSMAVVGETGDGLEVVDLVRRTRCDVLVLDLSLPGRDGMTLLELVREHCRGTAVVVLSMYPEDQLALAILARGALAYLCKDRDVEQLLVAIRRAARGLRYVTPELEDLAILAGPRSQEALPHERLSPRELQTMLLLVEGKTVSAIAIELDLSQSTVSGYVAQIREKLGVDSQGEILRYARRVGLM